MVANYGVTHKCGQTVKGVRGVRGARTTPKLGAIVTGVLLPKPWMFGAEPPPTPNSKRNRCHIERNSCARTTREEGGQQQSEDVDPACILLVL